MSTDAAHFTVPATRAPQALPRWAIVLCWAGVLVIVCLLLEFLEVGRAKLIIRCTSSAAGISQLYFADGAGNFSEGDSQRRTLQTGANELSFRLPRVSQQLRWDPLLGPGTFSVESAELRTYFSRFPLPVASFVAGHQIAQSHLNNGVLTLQTTPAADDPMVHLTIGRRTARWMLRGERALFALLLVATLALLPSPRRCGLWLAGVIERLHLSPARVVWGTWLALSVALVVFAYSYRFPTPHMDEWEAVGYVTRGVPITWGELWQQHNEHRLPLVKWLVIQQATLFQFDFRWNAVIVALLMSAFCAWLQHAVARWRGTARWADLFLPLSLLSWSHWELFQNTYALCILLPSIATTVLFVTLLEQRDGWNVRTLVFCLPWLILAILAGASGLAFVCATAAWLLLTSVYRLWLDPQTNRSLAVTQIGVALLLLGLVASTFYGLQKVTHHPPAQDWFSVANTFLELCRVGLTSNQGWVTFGLGLLVAALLGLATIPLLRQLQHPTERCRAAGLLLFLGAGIGLLLLMANARSGLGVGAGLASRYAIVVVPLLLFVSLINERYGTTLFERCVPNLLCGLVLLMLPLRMEQGAQDLGVSYANGAEFQRQIDAGLPAETIAEQNRHTIYPSPPRLTQLMREMQAMNAPALRNLAPAEVQLAKQPVEAQRLH